MPAVLYNFTDIAFWSIPFFLLLSVAFFLLKLIGRWIHRLSS